VVGGVQTLAIQQAVWHRNFTHLKPARVTGRPKTTFAWIAVEILLTAYGAYSAT
jgi:hypothetical protein